MESDMTTESGHNENHSVICAVELISHYSGAAALDSALLQIEEGELFTIRDLGAVPVLIGAAGLVSSLSYAETQRGLQRDGEGADGFADTLPEELAA
jgi:hypothetical protein